MKQLTTHIISRTTYIVHRTSLIISLSFWLLSLSAQTDNQTLRDSLKAAANELMRYPENIDLRLRKASWNMQLEQWQTAKDEYDRILDRQPDNLAALFFRAHANERLHRYAFARIDFEHVLIIVPTHFESRLGLALLNQKDNRLTEAMDQINILVQQHPDSAIAYAARAGMELERNMLSLAEFDYTEAIQRDPDNIDYLINRTDIYIRQRKYTEARRDLNRLQQLGVERKALDPLYNRIK